MTGGAGFTKDGISRMRSNASLLKKKGPFQRLKENLFRKKGENHIEIDSATVDELYEMKQERRSRERLRKRFFVIFRLVIFALIILVFWSLS